MNPKWMASSVEFGPGMKLSAETRSRKCCRSSQLRRRTTSSSISATWAAGPPKAVNPSRVNSKATSRNRPRPFPASVLVSPTASAMLAVHTRRHARNKLDLRDPDLDLRDPEQLVRLEAQAPLRVGEAVPQRELGVPLAVGPVHGLEVEPPEVQAGKAFRRGVGLGEHELELV